MADETGADEASLTTAKPLPAEDEHCDGASSNSKSPRDSITSPKTGRSRKNLEDLMRKRREICVEFESGGGASVAAADAAAAGYPSGQSPTAADAGTVEAAKRASGAGVGLSPSGLQEVLRKRREACANSEFESAPDGSTADANAAAPLTAAAASALVFESAPDGSTADANAAAPLAAAAAAALVFESAPDGSTADASGRGAAGGYQELGSGDVSSRSELAKRSTKTNDELRGWLDQLRGRCQVLESEPEAGSADAVCADWSNVEKSSASQAPHPRIKRPSVRDATTQGPRREEATPKEAGQEGEEEDEGEEDEAGDGGASPSDASPICREVTSPTSAAALDELHKKLIRQGAEPLAVEERTQVWTKQLKSNADGERQGDDQPRLGTATGLVRDLVSSEACFSPMEDSSAGGLASAFAERHLHWLVAAREIGAEEADKKSAELFAMFAQLVRYHYPAVAVAMERDAEVPVGNGLAVALEVACGGAVGLGKLLLAPRGQESEVEALRLLCDLVLLEEREGLLLFVATELLAEGRRRLGKTAFKQLRERGLAGRGSAGVRQCVERAVLLHDTTPLSLIFALSVGGWATARLQKLLPICSVAADEVLHHVYERKAGSWRLVVVDVRNNTSEASDAALALPVCLRLDPSQDRAAVLQDMPYNESIHLCLMGDDPPGPGEHAFELCHALATSSSGSGERRAHMSVAEGGWDAVASLARTLELELMRMEPEVGGEDRPRKSSGGLHKAAKRVLSRALGGFGA